MWIIGSSKKPRCFRAAGLKSIESLGIRWRANKKAWMVTGIMVDWLKWFDSQMAGRKVILLLDNFSAHTAAVSELEALPAGSGLTNTEICFLPPNATSRLQPLDQGIIAAFKARYRRRWISYMLEQHEHGLNALDTVNVLKAIQWSICAWDEVSTKTITNCWSHSKINLTPSPIPTETDEVVGELQQQLRELQKQPQYRIHGTMDVTLLLNPPEEEVTDITEDLDANIIAQNSPVDDEESDNEEVEVLPQVQPQQVLHLLQSIKLGEMQADDCNADHIAWIERYEKVIRRRHIEGLKQAGIQAFFAPSEAIAEGSRDHSI
jgi:hypothetical protein